MKKKTELTKSASSAEVDNFLDQVRRAPLSTKTSAEGRGRLIFAMDATASRQPTWDKAIALQHDMFTNTQGMGDLDVQLVFYRGMLECRNSRWVSNADTLCALMSKVTCLAGKTQIERILRHGLAETRIHPVNAMVFIGDCMEENLDTLGNLAGQLKILGLPVFIFQEGFDPQASEAFKQIAQLSGGAHCRFDQSSAAQLGQLLNAVAVYAAGGMNALKALSGKSDSAAKLLKQL